MMYNKSVQDCFFLPRHIGVLDLKSPYTVHYRSGQQNQINIIDLYLQCFENKKISRACFKANGNPYMIAALEWLCRQIEGRDLKDLPVFSYQVLIKELEIPIHQYPVALQVEGIYKEVLTLMNDKFGD